MQTKLVVINLSVYCGWKVERGGSPSRCVVQQTPLSQSQKACLFISEHTILSSTYSLRTSVSSLFRGMVVLSRLFEYGKELVAKRSYHLHNLNPSNTRSFFSTGYLSKKKLSSNYSIIQNNPKPQIENLCSA